MNENENEKQRRARKITQNEVFPAAASAVQQLRRWRSSREKPQENRQHI